MSRAPLRPSCSRTATGSGASPAAPTSSVSTVTIENTPHLVIGVLPADFPLSGSLFAGAPIDVFLPLTIDGNEDIGGFMAVIGRLRPAVTDGTGATPSWRVARRRCRSASGQWMTVLAQHVTPLPELVTRRGAIAGAPAPCRHRMRAADGVREPRQPAAGARQRPPP